MSALDEHAKQYLRARRALGVKLERHGRLLPELVAYLESAGASTITRELAISWARLPARAHPQHWAARLSIARGFAAYLQTIDTVSVVRRGHLPAARRSAGAAPAVEGSQLRDAVRAARRHRHASR
jgi:integrase/recombinase XerD